MRKAARRRPRLTAHVPPDGRAHQHGKFFTASGSDIREFAVLGMVPDVFDRTEVLGIAGQPRHLDLAAVLRQDTNDLRPKGGNLTKCEVWTVRPKGY